MYNNDSRGQNAGNYLPWPGRFRVNNPILDIQSDAVLPFKVDLNLTLIRLIIADFDLPAGGYVDVIRANLLNLPDR